MSQLLTASLADGRLQLWFIDTFGKLTSRSQTSVGVDATWTAWADFPSPSTSGLKSIAAGPLPADHRLQLWAVDNMDTLWSASQVSTTTNDGWTAWSVFPGTGSAGNLEAIGVAPLEDGRLQVWIIQSFTEVWIVRMISQDISMGWTQWTQIS